MTSELPGPIAVKKHGLALSIAAIVAACASFALMTIWYLALALALMSALIAVLSVTRRARFAGLASVLAALALLGAAVVGLLLTPAHTAGNVTISSN